ncbi:Gfo/Idh/MocA family protein [Paenibacillus pasadenensis]|uniref:Oxidoreductase domain protein n=1 Tax=Paenibacillus pasadenensis TaxID=217090 RepID=A0A2N5N2U3_9BACL|nr:Gfo/Idh/MocA family oxidoreductase [Paenibacillus pasadenensis]PLT44643.1 oxidoreductase domain protein [Paenibacillus pasadenensis]
MEGKKTIRWGIMGPGGISEGFAKDLAHAQGAELAAVAGRDPDKTAAFAGKFGIAKTHGSIEELAADPEVDIVYIGTVHPVHKEHALAALAAGKPVLCEKPLAMNAAEAREIAGLAESKGVFVMEAMWTRFLPAIRQARRWLDEGAIGEVRLLKAEFGFDAGWNPDGRLLNKDLGGGTLLDAGIYPVSFASFVFGAQPERIESVARIGETGVDEQFSLLLGYGDGRAASLHGSIRLEMENDAWIYGTKGRIRIPGFLWSRGAELRVKGEEPVVFEDGRVCNGYAFEAEEAMDALREGRTSSEIMPIAESVRILETMDRIRAQWGLTY